MELSRGPQEMAAALASALQGPCMALQAAPAIVISAKGGGGGVGGRRRREDRLDADAT